MGEALFNNLGFVETIRKQDLQDICDSFIKIDVIGRTLGGEIHQSL